MLDFTSMFAHPGCFEAWQMLNLLFHAPVNSDGRWWHELCYTKPYAFVICMWLSDSQDFLSNPHSLAAAKTCWETRSRLWRSSCKRACRWEQRAARPLSNRFWSLFTAACNPGSRSPLNCVLEVSQRWSEEAGAADGEAERAVWGEGPGGSAEGHPGQDRGCGQGGDVTGERSKKPKCVPTSERHLYSWAAACLSKRCVCPHQEALSTAKTEAVRWQNLYEELKKSSEQLKENQRLSNEQLQQLLGHVEVRNVLWHLHASWSPSVSVFCLLSRVVNVLCH